MPAVLTGPTVMQNLLFSSAVWLHICQYSFCLSMEGWPSWVSLGSWL